MPAETPFESAMAAAEEAVEARSDCEVLWLDSMVATEVAILRATESFELPAAEAPFESAVEISSD